MIGMEMEMRMRDKKKGKRMKMEMRITWRQKCWRQHRQPGIHQKLITGRMKNIKDCFTHT